MVAKAECEFLHCESEYPLVVVVSYFDRKWSLCGFHEKLVSKNGASIENEGGKDYLFSPVMMRGKSE